jgi:hypothetical protein
VKVPRPKKKKKKEAGAPTSRLYRYLNKLSSRRKAVEHKQRERVRFQLANMAIREITQSTMDPRSTLHTATSAGKTMAAA